MGIPLARGGSADMESCPHDDKIAELVTIAKGMDEKFDVLKDALIGSLENPGSGVLVRLATVERAAAKIDAHDDRLDAVEASAKEWAGLKKWGIGAILTAVAAGSGAGKLASYINQAPTPPAAVDGTPSP